MTGLRIAVLFLAGIAVLLAGCVHKPKQPVPSSTPAASSEPAKTDSADIFNEFYSDSAEALEKVKNLRTFSLGAKRPVPADTTRESPSAYTPAYIENGAWVVQATSVTSRVLADELSLELREKGYPSYVLEVQNPANLTGTYYRVRVGTFKSREDAAAFGENILKQAGLDYWVDRKSNETSLPLENQFNSSGGWQNSPSKW